MLTRAQITVTRITLALVAGVSALIGDGEDRDRGDVPGWVMITLMTAIVVVGLLAVFRGEVTEAVRSAFDSIK
jgi:hypothetical protein